MFNSCPWPKLEIGVGFDWIGWGLGEESSSFSRAVLSCDPASACGDALLSGAYSSYPNLLERRVAYGVVAQQILRSGLCPV